MEGLLLALTVVAENRAWRELGCSLGSGYCHEKVFPPFLYPSPFIPLVLTFQGTGNGLVLSVLQLL